MSPGAIERIDQWHAAIEAELESARRAWDRRHPYADQLQRAVAYARIDKYRASPQDRDNMRWAVAALPA